MYRRHFNYGIVFSRANTQKHFYIRKLRIPKSKLITKIFFSTKRFEQTFVWRRKRRSLQLSNSAPTPHTHLRYSSIHEIPPAKWFHKFNKEYRQFRIVMRIKIYCCTWVLQICNNNNWHPARCTSINYHTILLNAMRRILQTNFDLNLKFWNSKLEYRMRRWNYLYFLNFSFNAFAIVVVWQTLSLDEIEIKLYIGMGWIEIATNCKSCLVYEMCSKAHIKSRPCFHLTHTQKVVFSISLSPFLHSNGIILFTISHAVCLF